MPNDSSTIELLSSAHERARRLREVLDRQAAELAKDQLLDPAVRDAGLRAVQCAADCASRLVVLAEQAMGPDGAGGSAGAGEVDRRGHVR